MKNFRIVAALALVLSGTVPGWGQVYEVLRVQGSVSAAIPVAEASRMLRSEKNIEVRLTTTGGSPAGISALGDGAIDVALSTRHVLPEERADAPSVVFNEIPMAVQALAMVVSKDVWDGGVHSISVSQVRNIYENKIVNWKELGGPNVKIEMYLSSPGRGMWEMLGEWLYREVKKAPVKDHPTVNTYEEIRNAVEYTPGSLSQLPTPCVDNKKIFALSIVDDRGDKIEAVPENFVNGRYPLARTLYMVTNGRPTLNVKILVELMLGERGQKLIKDASLIPLGSVTPD